MDERRASSIGGESGNIFESKNAKLDNKNFTEEGPNSVDEEDAPLKFLVIPSFTAGVFLGTNNFFLGIISELGIAAAWIFSLGAIGFTLTYKLFEAIQMKR